MGPTAPSASTSFKVWQIAQASAAVVKSTLLCIICTVSSAAWAGELNNKAAAHKIDNVGELNFVVCEFATFVHNEKSGAALELTLGELRADHLLLGMFKHQVGSKQPAFLCAVTLAVVVDRDAT
jgi:hypothetical protein